MKLTFLLAAVLLFSTITGFSNDGETNPGSTVADKKNLSEVAFISFNAKKMNEGTLLRWTTGKEPNNSHFKIESSVDGLTWSTIALVFPPEIPAKINKYDYTYKGGAKTNVYYRIRMIGNDGKSTYSPVK